MNWRILSIHAMGAPLVFAPMEGPIHKRGEINQEGWFVGIQWPAALVKRKTDGKILSCARQKIRVYESAYLCELSQKVEFDDLDVPELQEVKEEFNDDSKMSSSVVDTRASSGETLQQGSVVRPELDKNRVQSIKSLREHRFILPGQSQKDTSELDDSAYFGNPDQFGGEGLYVDSICNQDEFFGLPSCLMKQRRQR